MKSRNYYTGKKLDDWKLPRDVRDVIDSTEYRLIDELFGDIGTAESLVDYVRAGWDCEDHERYTWEELTQWKY